MPLEFYFQRLCDFQAERPEGFLLTGWAGKMVDRLIRVGLVTSLPRLLVDRLTRLTRLLGDMVSSLGLQ